MKLILIILLFNNSYSFSQELIDSSYTINSTYVKEIKKFPFIKKAVIPLNNELLIQRDVVYKSVNNRDLTFDVLYNNVNKLNPGVILIHGGGWKSGNKSHMHSLAQEIALKGFTCCCVEYRLSDEAKYPAGIIDIKSAISFIRLNASKYNILKDKIAILGCSSGGQMATLVGTTNGNNIFEDTIENSNSHVQAIINLDGILAFKHPESQEGKMASYWLNGSYEEIPNIWNEASALEHCDSKTPPILFINSSLLRFHAGENDMIEKLKKFGVYYEVIDLPNSPHSFWFFHPWFDEIVSTSVKFLDKIFNN